MADGAPPLLVTRDNIESCVKGLPFAARQAFAFATRIRAGSLTAHLPDGRSFLFQGTEPGPAAEMIVRDLAFARRLVEGGDLGIGEAYLRGEWETPDLTRFLGLFCANHELIARMLEGRPLVRLWQRFRFWLHRNTKSGSRRNIHAHYDLGNRFYSAWLDGTMTYSAALFAEGDNDLSSAQQRKYRALAEAAQIGPQHHVLEIGCGWGGFAEYAAKEIGCRVTGLTISQEQFDYATRRMQEKGLSDRVTIKFQDYRDEKGVYDRIASIEMFEAVGEQYWPVYFDQLSERLTDDGIAALQVITIQDRLFDTYRAEVDFIRHYVFPGGMLPSPGIMKSLGEKVGLALRDERIFGHDYAVTLDMWRQRFREAWPQLTTIGFDERFRRLWEYYLAYCEAGFRSGNIDVRQMVYAKST
ncbi:cyclopropane-fatty-acyl-phospholipid synthase family protein [uncultured Alsobacter sp.]|uniref:SAM-dependent methyltransferase n=1 Tax=uncultured Alsobacter sp. TaxID=1748258 RepID=UPI0025E54EE2|nr:cyclopropane-fatty-acyl-phospholipid synthase family protein [uncultured Alsobacter sp.]